MATVTRKCPKCSRRFRVSNQSRRVKCEDCSPPRQRRGVVGRPGGDLPHEVDERVGPMEAQAAAEMARAGVLDTLKGQAVVRIARELDHAGTAGASVPGLVRQMLAAQDAALAGVVSAARAEPDVLDEIRQRRLAKAAAAS